MYKWIDKFETGRACVACFSTKEKKKKQIFQKQKAYKNESRLETEETLILQSHGG